MTRQGQWIGGSMALHVLLLAVLLHSSRMHVVPAQHPGTRAGTHLALVYSPGNSLSASAQAAIKPLQTPLSHYLKLKVVPDKPAVASVASLNAAAGTQGNNALGTGNVTIAFATFFPWPRPDLSALPRGTRGDVVIDITIDQEGRIVQTQVAQSMGSAIDQSVLSTIQSWTFKPATKDGIAVPSEQELLFHFEHA